MAVTTLAAAALGWRPTRRRLAAAGGGGTQALLAALGLRSPGLLAAALLPLALTAVLFAGPLLQLATDRRRRHARLALPPLTLLRNLVVAPLVEEFVFRSCMLSYLLACGTSPAAAVAFSPLLFAASHLHHVYDLTRFQGHSLRSALAAVAFQFSYTALFGWLAAWLFVCSRHLAAAALPHAFCNLMGPPMPPPHGAPGRSKILAAYTLGILGFCLLRPLSDPRLFANDLSFPGS
ncbi:CAAX prenyl protease 2-like [Chlorella sorokiniana]|uniref:intramembrane prenyl-peptidase Rce1 n=1 Tax=Chlorella sorokiniana TaxID=3076 RepID=A0A2P6TFF5_CHLSO|nr:CAAX prenyl protease 2-like [Chlorella sorokiniana]|eukprot:PRW32845.1 CAAX prenyl protease 2-like [Chlorella sorokiniana]